MVVIPHREPDVFAAITILNGVPGFSRPKGLAPSLQTAAYLSPALTQSSSASDASELGNLIEFRKLDRYFAVIAGSVMNWGAELESGFSLVVFLTLNSEDTLGSTTRT